MRPQMRGLRETNWLSNSSALSAKSADTGDFNLNLECRASSANAGPLSAAATHKWQTCMRVPKTCIAAPSLALQPPQARCCFIPFVKVFGSPLLQ
mmetsp:Transcript_134576/g.429854  ORF Transcript_134576/g.429854 Transcript_134576/m.429854 type:complete len:95 (-) Transcript_134576:359-643(-)